MYIMILYKIFSKNLFLTEWKDAPCPPEAALLQCPFPWDVLTGGIWPLSSCW